MNQKHLTQIWQWMSVACVLFVLTSLVSIQGGSEFIGRVFGDKAALPADNKPAIGYFGAIIGGALFFVASCALALHAIRHGRSWHDRIPVVWLEGLDTSAWEGGVFQAVVLVLFLAVPATGIALCIAEAEKGDICEQDTTHFYTGSEKTLLWPPEPIDGKQMRLRREGSGQEPCKTGIEILPVWTPVLVYGSGGGLSGRSFGAGDDFHSTASSGTAFDLRTICKREITCPSSRPTKAIFTAASKASEAAAFLAALQTA